MEDFSRPVWRRLPALVCFCLLAFCDVAWQQEESIPTFLEKPPRMLEFSNTTGARIPCSAKTTYPATDIKWLMADGSTVTPVKGLRDILPDGTLVLAPFKAEDFRQDVHSTVYKCAIENKIGIVVSNDVSLKAVVFQPFDVYVYDVFTTKGNTGVMKCHIPNFMARYVNVNSWIRDDTLTLTSSANTHGSKYSVVPTGELYVAEITADDSKSSFQCQYTNKLTGETKKSIAAGKFFVTEPQGNISPKIVFSTKIISEKRGNTVFLPCEAQGFPVPNNHWAKKGIKHAFDQPENVVIQGRINMISGSLVIKEVQKSDAGIYICAAENPSGKDTVEIHLNVVEELDVNLAPSDLTVDVGNSALLTCHISGEPVNNIFWVKDGQPLSLPNLELRSNISVFIDSVTSKHQGIYQCLAQNDVDGSFATVKINLGDVSPTVISGFEEMVYQPGPSIRLNCEFSGNPLPEITWILDGQLLSQSQNVRQTQSPIGESKVRSILTLKQLRTQDGGIYACKAQNKGGMASHVNRINVNGKLGSRPLVQINAVNKESVTLICPFYGYPFSNIQWEKDDQLVPFDIRQQLFSNGSLSIKSVQRSTDSGVYTCIVEEEGQRVASEVQLVVMVPPKLAPFSFQDELVREGMRGRLQCVVLEGDLPITLTWLKDGQPIPPSLGVKIRDIDEFSSILAIASINPRHNGNYTCLARNPAAAVSFTAQLSVNVAPKIIPFSFQESGLSEGVLARLSCVVYQGDLPINIKWLRDGKAADLIPEVVVRNIDDYSNILTIEHVNRKHAGTYTCVASNAAATVAHSTLLTVNVPPKIVPFSFQDEHLAEGMLVRVSCVVSRGDLPLTITWLKDGKPIPPVLAVSIREFDEYSSVISIEPVTSKHNGNYTCVARNHAADTSHTAELKIQVPPKWVLMPQDTTVKSGETTYLHCKASGLPVPTIEWMWTKGKLHKRKPISSNPNNVVLHNGTVILREVTKDQEGLYFCTASSTIGQHLSKAVSLSVLAPPSFAQRKIIALGQKKGNITLTCIASGDLPINFMWTVSNSMINPVKYRRYVTFQNESKTESLATSQLTISWLDRKDSNFYKCLAENKYGKDEMEFNVTVQDIPDAPVVQSTNENNHSVDLAWKQAFDGNSPITNYIIQYKKQKDTWQTRMVNLTVPADTTTTTVSGLQPSTGYHFRLAAKNGVGIGAFSEVITVTTEEGVPTGAPQNVEVESTDQQSLRVTWKPPRKSHWNGAIRGYNIGFRIEGSADVFTYHNLEVPEDYTEDLIYQLSDLKRFTQYGIIVEAYNTKGKGPASEPVTAMTSEGVPSSPPQGIRCSPLSSRSIYVLWDPPSPDTVNGIIRGFKVVYKPAKEWYESANQKKIVQANKITLQDLEVNTNYTIKVLAFTKVGDGVKSDAVFCKTHEDVPDAPQDMKVLPSSSDSVVVAWKSPKNSNGGIIKYNVYYKTFIDGQDMDPVSDGNDAVALMTEQVKQDTNSHVSHSDNEFLEVKGLKKNKKYAFWVTASSVIGEGPSSKVMAQTVADSKVPAKSASFDGTIKTPWKRDVVMPCKAVGVPEPQRKWMLGEKPIETSGRNVMLSDGTLLINKVSSEDSGNYTCAIYNEFGKDEIKYNLLVQVPPAAPHLEIVSKSKTSIELQWKSGPNGGERVRGYTLYFRPDNGPWETKELRPDPQFHNLNDLACGATYQIYLEAFNSIGTGAPCDVVTVSTEGTDIVPPSKESLVREGSTFVTVHLEAFASGGCPIHSYQVEYKKLHDREWTVVSDSLRPTQRKLVVPGLTPATWYSLRLTAVTSGKPAMAEYNFATHTPGGGTIPPPAVTIEEHPETVYLFYLDPYIFIPAVTLLIVIIIASVVICVCVKRKVGSMESLSDSASTLNTWPRTIRHGSHGLSSQYPTMPHRGSKDPSPYATAQLPDCFFQPAGNTAFVDAAMNPQFWQGTLGRRPRNVAIADVMPQINVRNERVQQSTNGGIQETTFLFPGSGHPEFTPTHGKPRPDEDYDQPPVGI